MGDIISILDAIKGAISNGASTRKAVRTIGKANGIPLDVRRRLNKYDFINGDFNTEDTELLNTEAVKPGTTQTTDQLNQNIKAYEDEQKKAQEEQAYQNKLNSVASANYDPSTQNFTYFDNEGNKVEGLDSGGTSSLFNIQNNAKIAKFQSDVNNKLVEWYVDYYNRFYPREQDQTNLDVKTFDLNRADQEWLNKAIQAQLQVNEHKVTQDGLVGNQTLTGYSDFMTSSNNSDVEKAALQTWYNKLSNNSNDKFLKIYDNRRFEGQNYNTVDLKDANKFNKTSYKQGGKMNRINYFQTGGAVSAQPVQQTEAQDIQTQVIQLVQKAMQGDKQSTQAIQAIMEKAQQGDEQATQIAQMIQAVIQQMQGQAKAAKRGAKLSYLHSLKTGCPEGYSVSYNKKGGHLCKECIKQDAEGDKVTTKPTGYLANRKDLSNREKLTQFNQTHPYEDRSVDLTPDERKTQDSLYVKVKKEEAIKKSAKKAKGGNLKRKLCVGKKIK